MGGNTNTKGFYFPTNVGTSIYGGQQTLATAFSRLGDYFVFGGNDKILNIFNATTKTVLQNITQGGSIRGADFSNDGRYLISGGDDKTLFLYDSICSISCDTNTFYNSTSKKCELCSVM